MADAKSDALREHFGTAVDTPEVLEACLSMCRIYNLTPEDLWFAAEAMKFNSKTVHFDMTQARKLHELLKKDTKSGMASVKTSSTPLRTNKSGASGSAFGKRMLAGTMSGVATPQSQVKTRVKREVEAGSPVGGGVAGKTGGQKFKIVPQENMGAYSYRYMFEKMHERSNALDSRIDEFGQLVKEYYNITDDLGDPNAETEEDVIVVGRIVDSSDSRLVESSMMIEPSRWMGSGKRIPIQFAPNLRFATDPARPTYASLHKGISVFPGAMAAFKGSKGHSLEGGFFMVREILPLPPLKLSKPIQGKGAELSFTVMVASGPYTFDNDLDFSPFRLLMAEVEKHQPSSLILLGPFIDPNHALIKDGDVEFSLEKIFMKYIATPLQAATRSQPDMSVGLVPTVRDLMCDRNVYPQGAFIGPESFQAWQRVTILSNPCTFTIGSITFGVTTVDVPLHLRKSEVFKPIISTNQSAIDEHPMAGVCRHLLDQRSFYPIFPVPKEFSGDVNLDVSHSRLLGIQSGAPDVMVLPSKLKEFTQVVEGTTFVNPSSTSKFNSGGMFAKITVDALRQGSDRISVNLIKL